MPEFSRSLERRTFQKDAYIKRCKAHGIVPSNEYIRIYEIADQMDIEFELDEKQHKNNLEYDLRSTSWILEKVRASDTYAQNLYAAMCNNDFQRNDVWPILKDETWGCSWRYAGGIVADMQEKGDYIDWYCSGIGNSKDGFGLSHASGEGYVPEGQVTDEIKEDLFKLGWIVVDEPEE
jgi:hypothetical protein